jgi:CHAD domain-containing protein
LAPVAESFNAAVAQCVEDADLTAVHRLRTGSRRLQAMLEATLREGGEAANGLEQPARAWLRQLQRIRRAASAVRDLDVHRQLLEGWMDKRAPKLGASGEPGTAATPVFTQAEMLAAWLKGERKQLAHGMQKQIQKRQQKLAEQQKALLDAIGQVPLGSSTTQRSAEATALEDFVRAADAMPLLDAENLHDFRKATKKARYVAESGAEGTKYGSVAKALKRIQDAIGEWHDWQCLAQEARTALGQDAPELTAAFAREVERHFAAAMKTTQTMRGRLLGEWMAQNEVDRAPARRPPAAVTTTASRLQIM